MAVRKCALDSAAFLKLKEAYEHREEAARAAKAAGKKIVGTLGYDVPEEIILAGGMMSVPVYAGYDIDMKVADRYLEYAFDPMVRAQFEKIVDGSYNDLLDWVVVSNSTDVLIRIYLYLRELKRVETEVSFPPVSFIDWLFTRNRMHQERNRLVVSIFREEAEKMAGRAITDEEIAKAGALLNDIKGSLRQIDAFRTGEEMHLTGTEMLIITGSGFFMDKEEYAAVLRELKEEISSWPAVTGKRVFYTGSVQMDTALYEEVEAEGAVIVGEDHDLGDRYFDRDYDTGMPAVRALVDEYMLREFSSKKAFVSQRVEALEREVKKANAEGVLFYFHIYEEAASWDYPEQKKCLTAKGIDTLQFAKMHWPRTEEENAAFAEGLKKFVSGKEA